MMLISCGEEKSNDNVTLSSIEIANNNQEIYLDEDINFGAFTLKLTYSNGKTEQIPVTSSMITYEDQQLFSNLGINSIKVTYENLYCYLQLTVKEREVVRLFKVTYHTNSDDSIIDAINTNLIKAFPIPEKSGFEFIGWYSNIDFNGEKCSAPYKVTKDMDFYARWVDERECVVTYYDYQYDPNNPDDSLILKQERIHYGESIDLNSFEYPNKLVGSTFKGWQVLAGSENNIQTERLSIRAMVQADTCNVSIVYLDTSDDIVTTTYEKRYGDVVDLSTYKIPTKEGHTSKWVITYDDGLTYQDVEGDTVTLTHETTKIEPYYTIYTYTITIQNGSDTQDDEKLKNGIVTLKDVYENEELKQSIKVDWMGSFDYEKYDQEINLRVPETVYDSSRINGFDSRWCYVVQDSAGVETWYDGDGNIYNPETDSFAPQEFRADEGKNNWILRDANQNMIARVTNKKLYEITSNITMRAKYIKKSYTVFLYRTVGNANNRLAQFKVRYGVDFNPYDNKSYQFTENNESTNADVLSYSIIDTNLENKLNTFLFTDSENNKLAGIEGIKKATVESIKQLYLTENTDYDIKQISTSIYSTFEGETSAEDYLVDDISIRWYVNSSIIDNNIVDFYNGATKVIKQNENYYCNETNDRYYIIRFFDFDFDEFKSEQVEYYYKKENDNITPNSVKEGYTKRVTYNLDYVDNEGLDKSQSINLTYYFLGWYTTPYEEFLKTGVRGESVTSFTKRTASQNFYAHYNCTETGSFGIIDTTQSYAYTGTAYPEQTVANGSISYSFSKGSVIVMDMIFKGVSTGEGNINIVSSTVYQNYLKDYFYHYYVEDNNSLYKQIVNKFSPTDNIANAKTNITTIINIIDSIIVKSLNEAIEEVYKHTYNGYIFDDYNYLFNMLKSENSLGYTKATNLIDLYQNKFNDGSKIRDNMDEANYSETLANYVGNFSDFIISYVNSLIDMYQDDTYREAGYINKDYVFGHLTDRITGFTGLTRYLDSQNSYVNSLSDNTKLIMIKYILQKYVNFLTTYENGYSISQEVEDQIQIDKLYKYSNVYLNRAHGYDVSVDEIKYEFSGWFKDSNYSEIYQSDFNLVIPVADNIPTLYAKWTDITKGTEGLLYEEVTYKEAGEIKNGYVLVNLLTQAENKEEYNSENYYLTKNDANNIPTEILPNTILQIPATIDKYLIQDNSILGPKWENGEVSYTDYFVYEQTKGIYIQAGATFNNSTNYYIKEEYPVIGIAKDALANHASCLSEISLPLNLYFIEEGAFRDCLITNISKAAKKASETEYDYVVFGKDEGNNNTAIYQWEECPFTEITGKASYNVYYKNRTAYSIIAFAKERKVGNEYPTEFSLLTISGQDTLRIGDYAFNTSKLTKILNTESLEYIGKKAFNGSDKLTQFGSEINKILIPKNVVEIGESAFADCTSVNNIEVENLSKLQIIGYEAFVRTKWQAKQKGIISISFVDNLSITNQIILGFDISEGSVLNNLVIDNEEAYVKYNELGNQDNNGLYYAIINNGNILLYNTSFKCKYAIFNTRVKYISNEAFVKVNENILGANKFVFNKFVERIGNKAFQNYKNLTDIYVFRNGEAADTILLGDDVFGGVSIEGLTIHTDFNLDTSEWPVGYLTRINEFTNDMTM